MFKIEQANNYGIKVILEKFIKMGEAKNIAKEIRNMNFNSSPIEYIWFEMINLEPINKFGLTQVMAYKIGLSEKNIEKVIITINSKKNPLLPEQLKELRKENKTSSIEKIIDCSTTNYEKIATNWIKYNISIPREILL